MQPSTYERYPAPTSLAHLVPNLPEEGVDLLTRMLQHDPTKRITAREALDHPFFASIPPALREGGVEGTAGGAGGRFPGR